jgi:hypothetical protein
MSDIVDLLFGCFHKRTGGVFTSRQPQSNSLSRTYVVCLDCGKEFPYNLEKGRFLSRSEKRQLQLAVATGNVADWVANSGSIDSPTSEQRV